VSAVFTYAHAVGYAIAALTMVLLDALWLGVVAKPLYQDGLAGLLASSPRWSAAVAFYLLYPLGVMVFVVAAAPAAQGWPRTALLGALFGFFCYATYDLSNLATLKGWPAGLSMIDIAWGALLTMLTARAGRAATAAMNGIGVKEALS